MAPPRIVQCARCTTKMAALEFCFQLFTHGRAQEKYTIPSTLGQLVLCFHLGDLDKVL